MVNLFWPSWEKDGTSPPPVLGQSFSLAIHKGSAPSAFARNSLAKSYSVLSTSSLGHVRNELPLVAATEAQSFLEDERETTKKRLIFGRPLMRCTHIKFGQLSQLPPRCLGCVFLSASFCCVVGKEHLFRPEHFVTAHIN